MKPCILFAIFATALSSNAQLAQPSAPPITPDTVVERTAGGKDVTAGELNQLRATVPGVSQALRSDPAGAIQLLTFEKYMTDEARKLKLEEATPGKSRLRLPRKTSFKVRLSVTFATTTK